MNSDIVEFFAKYIEKQLGIVYSESNFFQLHYRLVEIAKQNGLPSVDALYERAKAQGIEGAIKALLLDVATNNETSFFRDQSVFRMFIEKCVPEISKRPGAGKLRVWSAASSSGQEVYSLLMEYDQALQKDAQMLPIEMVATDVSSSILERAKAGRYSQLEVQRGLPARYLIRYFDKIGEDRWEVRSFLKDRVQFQKLNLLHDFSSLGQFDIVFCRNVLIYQSVESKKDIIDRISHLLQPGGFLVLGAAESLFGLSDKFNQVEFNGAIGYQKK